MATMTMIDEKENLDGSLSKRVYDMLAKLRADDTTVGAHVEPIKNAVDPRIRSVRVNDKFRALLFRIGGGEQIHYVYVGTFPHDDAYARAATQRLTVNPVNGVLTLVREQDPAIDARIAAANKRKAEIAEAQAKAAEAELAAGEAEVATSGEGVATGKAPAAPPSPAPQFAQSGIDAAVLDRQLGITGAVVDRALAAESLNHLEAVLSGAAPWERDALLGLAMGYSIEDVRAELGLSTAPASTSSDHDEELTEKKFLEAVKLPASSMQFIYLGDSEDADAAMREIIENRDFQAWTTFLHPTQRILATRSRKGSWRVSGGAGTGKTVVALHRTKALVDGTIDGPGLDGDAPPRVLLTTFTKTLASALERQLAVLDATLPKAAQVGDPGVRVAGIDQVTMAALRKATKDQISRAGQRVLGEPLTSAPTPLSDQDDRELWVEAVERSESAPEGPAGTPDFLRGEFEAVVLAQGVTSKGEYLKADRSGRGTALNRKARVAVWSVIEAYLAITRRENKHTFPVLGCLAAAVLDLKADAGQGRLVDHAVVDEAQDFHVGHWRLLRAVVADGPNDLFISEDGHQRIYGRPTRLSHFGINIRGRANRLKLNYRTTAENLGFAMRILEGATFVDTDGEEDSTEGYRSARSGPVPEITRCDTLAGELSVAEQKIREWLDGDEAQAVSIGVLTHNKRDVDRIADGLASRGISVSTGEGPGVHVMTMHSSKGMEFSHVVLARVSEGTMPGPIRNKSLTDEDRDLLLRRERSLLYVAASRARDQLVVTTGAQPSSLLPSGSIAEAA